MPLLSARPVTNPVPGQLLPGGSQPAGATRRGRAGCGRLAGAPEHCDLDRAGPSPSTCHIMPIDGIAGLPATRTRRIWRTALIAGVVVVVVLYGEEFSSADLAE